MTDQDCFTQPPVTAVWPEGKRQTGVLHARYQLPGTWSAMKAPLTHVGRSPGAPADVYHRA
ncbi:hypothetical protein ABZ829_11910 [Streptomyces xanthochromogenes]|uniref:hypothetical protein n=1 Tax=Streptomyces xanthochromogenes TaxID=67384 RepID=UPI00342FE976